MSRRLFIGKRPSDGAFKIRQSKPGFDALTASIENVLFDADYVPGKILGSGSFLSNAGTDPQVDSWSGGGGVVTTVAHGLGRAPDAMAVIGACWDPLASAPGPWVYSAYGSDIPGGKTLAGISNAAMENAYCTPFFWRELYSFSNSSATGRATCGWFISADASNIVLTNFMMRSVHVQWTALEFI